MFDGSSKTFEVAKRLDGASIIATQDEKIIILKQKQPDTKWYYTLPGGYMDKKGESPKQAALRELMEETGLKPGKIRLWKSYDRGGRIQSKVHIFIANDCKQVASQDLDGGEKIEVKKVTFEQFLKFSDDVNFHNRELIIYMLQARLSEQKKRQFKKLIFG